MVEPIRPQDIKPASKPDGVIESFNDLIIKYWDGRQSKFEQCEIADLIAQRMNVERAVIFSNRWLDIEALYEEYGWSVYYDKPGYNEAIYEPVFTFSPAK